MSKQLDRYSQLDGYTRAYTFFRDILTDNRYKPRALTIEDSEHWLTTIEKDLAKWNKEIDEL